MGRILLFLCLGIFSLNANAGPIKVVIDGTPLAEPGINANTVFTGQMLAQSFTASSTGFLSRIDVQIWKQQSASGDVTLDLVSLVDGFPGNSSILTRTIPLDIIPTRSTSSFSPVGWTSVFFDPLVVAIGDQFAIRLSRIGSANLFLERGVLWSNAGGGDRYGGGLGFLSNFGGQDWGATGSSGGPSSDFSFRTFTVAVPEPSTLGLLGAALLGLGLKRGRRVA